jgi:hypothetical protein
LSSFGSLEGPPLLSESPASGIMLEVAEEAQDPDIADEERGTDPERDPKETDC